MHILCLQLFGFGSSGFQSFETIEAFVEKSEKDIDDDNGDIRFDEIVFVVVIAKKVEVIVSQEQEGDEYCRHQEEYAEADADPFEKVFIAGEAVAEKDGNHTIGDEGQAQEAEGGHGGEEEVAGSGEVFFLEQKVIDEHGQGQHAAHEHHGVFGMVLRYIDLQSHSWLQFKGFREKAHPLAPSLRVAGE